MYDLPKTVEINGKTYAIRSDYRDILNVIAALNNPDLGTGVLGDERAYAAMYIFYPDFDKITDHVTAFDKLCWFVDRGNAHSGSNAKTPLYDFERDESLIAPAIGQVLNCRIREISYLHWWDFVDAFTQIGDGLFAQVVGVRARKSKGKMTKDDKAFYAQNKELIDRVRPNKKTPQNVRTLTPEEGEEFLKKWRNKGVTENAEQ